MCDIMLSILVGGNCSKHTTVDTLHDVQGQARNEIIIGLVKMLCIFSIAINTWSQRDDPHLKPFAAVSKRKCVQIKWLTGDCVCLPALCHVLKSHQGGLLRTEAMSRDGAANWAVISGGERTSLQWSLVLPVAVSSLPSTCHAGRIMFTLHWSSNNSRLEGWDVP